MILPKELAEKVPRTHLMTESEWRNLGVQQSPGWMHYLIHEPGKIFKVSRELSITVKNLLLFQRKIYSQLADCVGQQSAELIFNVAKCNLGEVKLERISPWLSPIPLWGVAGSLWGFVASVILHCCFAC